MFFVTEKKLRKIVQDEIELAALDFGGIYDETRLQSFAMTQAIITGLAENVLKALPDPTPNHEATREMWRKQRADYNYDD